MLGAYAPNTAISIPVPAQGLGQLVRPARSLTRRRRCRLARHLHKGEGRGHRHRRPISQARKAQQPQRGVCRDLQGIRGRRTSRHHQARQGPRGPQVSQVQNGAGGRQGEAGRGAHRGEHGGHTRHRAPPSKGTRRDGDRGAGAPPGAGRYRAGRTHERLHAAAQRGRGCQVEPHYIIRRMAQVDSWWAYRRPTRRERACCSSSAARPCATWTPSRPMERG